MPVGDGVVHGGRRRDERGYNASAYGAVRVVLATKLLDRLRGLLFRRPCANLVLVLSPCRDVHTVGMRHRLDIAFMSRDGTVVAVARDVVPWRRVRCKCAAAVLERFAQTGAWVEVGDETGLLFGWPKEGTLGVRARGRRNGGGEDMPRLQDEAL